MGAGWPYITFQVFQLVKMKLFLLKLSLSLHSCLFDCSIVFVVRAVHLIILEAINAKKCKILVAFFFGGFCEADFDCKSFRLSCNFSQQLGCATKAEILLGEAGRLIEANC